MSHQALSAGDKWWEMGHTCKMSKRRPEHLNFKLLGPQVAGQWVARDIYIESGVCLLYMGKVKVAIFGSKAIIIPKIVTG